MNIGDQDTGTLSGELERRCAANAGARTGNKGCLAGKVAMFVPPVWLCWMQSYTQESKLAPLLVKTLTEP